MNTVSKLNNKLGCAQCAISAILTIIYIMVLSMNSIIAYGDTGNDLRDSLGISRRYYNESLDGLDGYTISDSNDDNTDTNETNIESSNSNESESNITYDSIINADEIKTEIENKKAELDSLESILSSRMRNRSTAYLVTLTVNDIFKIQEEIYELETNLSNVVDSQFIINQSTESDSSSQSDTSIDNNVQEHNSSLMANSYSKKNIESVNSDTFDIGYIGDKAPCIVDGQFKLVTPWGFTKKASESNYGNKFLGIELYAKENSAIVSQWNGVVVEIGNDDSNKAQYIKIYHGNGIYTVYRHINAANDIAIGDKVGQSQTIGYAVNTTNSEPEKLNHVMYQLEIDDEYINPLLIYGSSGKYIYEQWLTTTSYDNVVEYGEKYYNDIEVNTDIDNTDNPPEVLYPDFNIE